MSASAISPSDAVAFGNLADLTRLQVGKAPVEICDACSTINMGSARYCKCCSHKLRAFYADTEDGMKRLRVREATLLPWHSLGMWDRASLMDFAAFTVVSVIASLLSENTPTRDR